MKITWTGINELKRALSRADELAATAIKAGLVEEAESIMAESKSVTPVDTGVLRASGTVLPPEQHGTKVTVTMGYGGAAQQYAIPVHERLGVSHPSGQAKYLEGPFLARAGKIPANVSRRIERAWQRLRSV